MVLPVKFNENLNRVTCPRQAKIIPLDNCRACGDFIDIIERDEKIIVDCPNTPPTRLVLVRGGEQDNPL